MNTAYVKIWGRRVGAVSWDSGRGVASFEYESGFAASRLDLAPLRMPIERTGTVFSFPELAGTTTFRGLPGLLADVLPDKYGNMLINAWLARNGRAQDSMHPVELLCFIGKRGMGALEFEPATQKTADTATQIELSGLIEIAGHLLNDRSVFSTSFSNDQERAMTDILKIGTSAGGARAKALIAYNEQTGEVRSGQADAPEGFSHWLIKFDGVHDSQFGATYGFGRVEMAYYLMALHCGIDMMESRLLEEQDRAHFMTRRFDRVQGNGKLHLQSWCALNHFDFQEIGTHGYEELFQTMRALGLPYPQAEQLFRRMVFNVLARNCDDHTKNFAFLMDPNGVWRLSPAFDICHAYRPGSPWVSRQSLLVNGKREGITRDDFLEVARRMNIRKPDRIVSEISETVSRWSDYAAEANVDPKLSESIRLTLLNA